MLHSPKPLSSFSFRSPSATPQRSSLGRLVNQSTMLLMVSIGTLILVLALLILFHQNSNATKGYQLRTLERERSQLLLEQEVLNMEVAQAQAMAKIEGDDQIGVMAQVRNPQYVEGEPSFAKLDRNSEKDL